MKSEVQAARIAIIIPARMNSTRLSRKLLLSDTGKPIIQHTYETASRSTLAQIVGIATVLEFVHDTATRGGIVACDLLYNSTNFIRAADAQHRVVDARSHGIVKLNCLEI